MPLILKLRPLLQLALAAIVGVTSIASNAATAWGASHFTREAKSLYVEASDVAHTEATDVTVLDEETNFSFDATGRRDYADYVIYKVLTQQGAENWSNVAIEWEPWHEERPQVRVRVITPDFTVHELDSATLTDTPAQDESSNIYSDRRVLRAPLPAVAPGSVVEQEVMVHETKPYFSAGAISTHIFGHVSVPVHHSRLTLQSPAAIPLRYVIRLLPDLKPYRSEADGQVQIVFEPGPLDGRAPAESHLPSDMPSYPSVVFSTGLSWQEVARKYSELVEPRISTSDVKAIVERLTRNVSNSSQKTQALLHYLNTEIRYTGVEFGSAAIVPGSPAETVARRYGDCKDKATLLVAMLRAAGISAYIALLKSGNGSDVPADLPGMGLFDHAIVYLPGPPDLWIDATDEYARLGQLSVADQGRLALVVRPETTTLVRTSQESSQENLLLELREITLAAYGPAHILERTRPQGSIESLYRRSYTDKQDIVARDKLTEYVKSQYLAEKLDHFDRSEPSDLSHPFELVVEVDRARRGFTDLGSAVAAIPIAGLFYRLPSEFLQREKPGDVSDKQGIRTGRTVDYQLPESFVTEWRYTIKPPEGFQPKTLPKNSDLNLGPSHFVSEFSSDRDNTVHATFRFDTVKRRISAVEADDLGEKLRQLLGAEPVILIYFQPTGQALSNDGKFREGLQAERTLIKRHPTEAIYHLRIAQGLLAAGLGESARAETQTAIKLDPRSAVAQKTLGEILEYDVVGRKFRPGSDYSGAEVAFRAAESLDPEDKSTIANLAILLEYNRWGVRYGPGAKLKEAVAEYRKLTGEQMQDFGIARNPAYALFYAGEFSEAKKAAQALRSPQPSSLIVACEAVLNGSSAGLAEARKRAPEEKEFKEVTGTAGEMLEDLRKYALAADFKEAGASTANASDMQAVAALLRKTQPHEDLHFGDDPAGVALRFILLEDNPDLTIEQLRSTTSRNGAVVLANREVRDHFTKKQLGTIIEKARNDENADIGIDLSMVRAQPLVQGNDTSGYRVTLWPTTDYKQSVFILKEDGHYKVLAISPFKEGLALEALDRLSAGDVSGAHTLLAWYDSDHPLRNRNDRMPPTPFWEAERLDDSGKMRMYASSILVGNAKTAERGVTILESTMSSASESQKLDLAFDLAWGYYMLHKDEQERTLLLDMMRQVPNSKPVFVRLAYCLRRLDRVNESDHLTQTWLRNHPDDEDAIRRLLFNAVAREDFSRARELDQELLNKGMGGGSELDGLAWYSFFVGKTTTQDLETALKATQVTNNASYSLHTLGCIYAELGKLKEARDVLVQAMDSGNYGEPDGDFWFAFGLIAEKAGERETALSYYQRVRPPEDKFDLPGSSHQLAQIRIHALN